MADWYSELISGPEEDEAGYYPELVGADEDEAGYYPELVGADEDDAGAPLRGLSRLARRRRAARRRSMALRGGRGTLLTQAPRPVAERRLFLSGREAVAPGATQVITIVPQVIFRPEKMILQATSPATMLLLDVKIGTRSQGVAGAQTGIPFPAFGPNVQDVLLEFDTASIQSLIQVLVQNSGASADTAFVTFIGTSAVP